MGKTVIIHGTKGSPSGNWFPWLAGELRKSGEEVIVPAMPTPEGQTLSNWLDTFNQQAGEVDESDAIIGHSAGAVFLLRLLERLDKAIGCSVFVAGFTGMLGLPEFDSLNASFVAGPFDWAAIKRNAGRVMCFSGDNDPYVPLKQGLEIASNLGVEPFVIRNGGHLNASSGYTAFPLLLEKLALLREKKRAG